MRRFAIVVAALAALAPPLSAQEAQTPRLTVSGEGEAAAVPDLAVITLGVTERADSAAAAMDNVSTAAARILSRLEERGVASRDVQTSDLSLNPIYVSGEKPGEPSRIEGYEASNQVTVRVRALDGLGDVLAAALDDGANTLGGLRFEVTDPEPLMNEARRDAVADARAKAELYASAAGVRLGRLLSIEEGGGGGRPMPMAEMRAASVPVAAGETGYGASVRLVYELLQD